MGNFSGLYGLRTILQGKWKTITIKFMNIKSLLYMVNNYNNFCIAVLQNFELEASSISKLHKKRKKRKIVVWNGFGRSSLYFTVFFHSKKDRLYTSCMYNAYRNARKHTETAHLPMPESTTSLPTELGIQTPLYCVDIALFGASVVTLILDTF